MLYGTARQNASIMVQQKCNEFHFIFQSTKPLPTAAGTTVGKINRLSRITWTPVFHEYLKEIRLFVE